MAYIITEYNAPKLFTLFLSPQYSRIGVTTDAADVLPTIGTLTLRTWEGHKTAVTGSNDVIVQRMTSKSVAGENETTFDISPYLKDAFGRWRLTKFLPAPSGYYNPVTRNMFWYSYTITFNNGAPSYTSPTNLAMSGWGEHLEGINPGYSTYAEMDDRAFGISNNQLFSKHIDQLFYVFVGVGTANLDLEEKTTGVFVDLTAQGGYNTDFSSQQFATINVSKLAGLTGCMDLTFEVTGDNTGTYKMTEETNRNNHIEVRYLGKDGFQNSFHFLGRINESLSVSKIGYEKSPLTTIGVVDSTAHINTDINIQGSGKFTANTGEITEVQSRFLIELLLSSKIWVIEKDDTRTPVTVETKNLDIQNMSYESLKNHTIVFNKATPIVAQS